MGSKTSTEGLVDIPFCLILMMTTAQVFRHCQERSYLGLRSLGRSYSNIPPPYADITLEDVTFFKLCRQVGVRPQYSSSPGLALTSCATSLNFITMEVSVVR